MDTTTRTTRTTRHDAHEFTTGGLFQRLMAQRQTTTPDDWLPIGGGPIDATNLIPTGSTRTHDISISRRA